ncbi:MAG: NAD-dependent epimerase/dehydratase family protein [Acidimicrobiia bacterium]|nr:MAG: NAD-dependent epimerase/dehydratase family protein [Acidimicrobiia bacterium]
MPTIFITGAATRTGGQLVRRLEREAETTVVAVDDIDPIVPFASRFERLSLDRLALARFLLDTRPDTVIHLQTVDRSSVMGGTRSHDESTVGAQALFGAIGRCETVRHVVVRSDGAVYGSSPRAPSVARVDSKPVEGSGRFQRDMIQMEQFVRDVAATHDHVDYTILRFAPVFGPTIRNPISRYLTLPGVPTLLGFDPRLQFIGEHDALAAFIHTIAHPVPGTFNVAAPGQLYLSRVLRLGLRIAQPLPKRALHAALRGLARAGLEVPRHTVALLKHGRVMETSATTHELGFTPRLTSRQVALTGYGRVRQETLA